MGFQQGARSVSTYAIEFRTLAADSGQNDSSLWDAFHNGLSEGIQDLLVMLDQQGSGFPHHTRCQARQQGAREREREFIGLQLPEAPAPTSRGCNTAL